MARAKIIAFALLVAAGMLRPAEAITDTELGSVRFDQNLGQTVPSDAPMVDEENRGVTLGSYLNKGKPVILVPGYYECPMLCSLVTNALIESLQELKLDIGRDFEVVHVSIDPKEGPPQAAAKKRVYVTRYGRAGAAKGWHFLTGTGEVTGALMQKIGFHSIYDPASRQYAHASGFLVLTPEGKIARYFFGVNFPPGEMRTALLGASQHSIGGMAERLFLLCFHYNPLTGKYSLTIRRIVQACGAGTVLAMGIWIGATILRGGKARPSL
jgi:protein SCO1